MFSYVQFFVTPWTVACQAPLSLGFPRQDYWSGLPRPPPGDLLHSGIEARSPALQADFLPSEPLGKPQLSQVWFQGYWNNIIWYERSACSPFCPLHAYHVAHFCLTDAPRTCALSCYVSFFILYCNSWNQSWKTTYLNKMINICFIIH